MKKFTTISFLCFFSFFIRNTYATVWQVAAPFDLLTVYNATAVGYTNFKHGDIIELTTDGGNYTWSENIYTDSKSVIIRAAIGLSTRPTITLSSVTAGVAFTCSNITVPISFSFEGIVFNGHATSTGLLAPKNNNLYNTTVTMNNCKLYNFGAGATAIAYSPAGTTVYGDLTVTNSQFFDLGKVFYISSSSSFQPANVLFYNCLIKGTTSTGGILAAIITGGTIYPLSSIIIDHCTFEASADKEIFIKSGAANSTLVRNSIFAHTALPTVALGGTNNVLGNGNSDNQKNGVYYTAIPTGNLAKYPWINGSATGQAFLIADPLLDETTFFATNPDYSGAGTDGKSIGYYNAAPIITSFSPTIVTDGTSVIITGSNFTDTRFVSFGSTPAASFVVNSDTQITAVVASGGSGDVIVTNSAGVGIQSGLTYSTNNQTITTTVLASQLTLSSVSEITIANDGELIIDSPTSINSLIVESGGRVTNSSTLNVPTLTINSDANGTGTFVDSGISNISTANINQYLGAARNWYISSPITNAKAKTGYKFYNRDETNDIWVSMITGDGKTTGDPLIVGKGYIANIASGTSTYTFTGSINSGNPVVTVFRTSAQPVKSGFNLVGNPFPSYLNGRTLVNTTDNLDKSIWYRTQKNNSTTYYFDTYNTLGGIGTNNSKNSPFVIGTIPPMQAFWVRVASGHNSATLNFLSSYRTHKTDTINMLKSRAMNQSTSQLLRLEVTDGINSDETIIYTHPYASNSIDPCDSPKMLNGTSSVIPDIYTKVGSEFFAINGMSFIPYNTEIPLYFYANSSDATTFSIELKEQTNFEADVAVYIKNNLSGEQQLISDGSKFSFASSVLGSEGIFSLIINVSGVKTGLMDFSRQNVLIYRNDNNLIEINYIDNTSSDMSVIVHNSYGQKLISKKLTGNKTELVSLNKPGVYLVTVKSSGNKITNKVTIF